jgi:hypothetical protein
MIHFQTTKDWESAFFEVIPGRKGLATLTGSDKVIEIVTNV